MKYKKFIARVLEIGERRIKINSSDEFKLKEITTREKIREAVSNNNILILRKKGLARKKKRTIKYNKKTKRLHKVRLLRSLLKENRLKLNSEIYRNLYLKIKSGVILTKKRLFELLRINEAKNEI